MNFLDEAEQAIIRAWTLVFQHVLHKSNNDLHKSQISGEIILKNLFIHS